MAASRPTAQERGRPAGARCSLSTARATPRTWPSGRRPVLARAELRSARRLSARADCTAYQTAAAKLRARGLSTVPPERQKKAAAKK